MTVENDINNNIANTPDNDVAQTVNKDTVNVIDNAVTADNNAKKVADNTADAQPTKNPTKLDIKGPKITKDGLKIKNNDKSTKGNNRGLGILLLFSGNVITMGIGVYFIIYPDAS